jgi:enoyl-CoA hydratase/carnithine racemase
LSLPFALAAIAEAGGLGFHEGPADEPPPAGAGIVRVGLAADGPLPTDGLEAFDVLLTQVVGAPTPWVYSPAPQAASDLLHGVFVRHPLAAAAACQVLRMSLAVPFADALVLESLAYSMLLSSADFAAWRGANPARPRGDDAPRVALERTENGALVIRLTRAAARNAVDARMRDALCEALAFAAEDPDQAEVFLCGDGPSFSAGGDLAEFGSAGDAAAAHAIRTLRSAAAGVAAIAPRVTARLHGACIGAGIEIPAAAGRVVAAPDTKLRLPEVAMGLIPGAGGTATLPRRIGRHRTAWMALSGLDIDADTARGWGLVDAIEPSP